LWKKKKPQGFPKKYRSRPQTGQKEPFDTSSFDVPRQGAQAKEQLSELDIELVWREESRKSKDLAPRLQGGGKRRSRNQEQWVKRTSRMG